MQETTLLKLKTYNESDNPSFLEYRKSLNNDTDSNMTKIDEFAQSIVGKVITISETQPDDGSMWFKIL